MSVNERALIGLTEKFAPNKKIKETPFPVLTYDQAMNRYGSDKPDLRFDMEFTDVTDIAKGCDFSVFKSVAESGGIVKALRVEGGGKFTRKEIDELTEVAKIYKAKGLAYIIVEKGVWTLIGSVLYEAGVLDIEADTELEILFSQTYELTPVVFL